MMISLSRNCLASSIPANALPVMFNAKDTQSRYLFMNRYQAELYGVSTDAVVGRTADDLLGEDYGTYTRSIDAEVIRTGQAMPFFEETYDGTATYLILAHLSESNNLPELARMAAERALTCQPSLLGNRLHLARQDEPLESICF